MPISKLLATASVLSLLAPAAHATVRLPALVGSHMVLQRDRPVPVWGWAAPGEKVSLTFQGKTYRATPPMPAGAGRLRCRLPPPADPACSRLRGRIRLR